jgi:hypothetical protein
LASEILTGDDNDGDDDDLGDAFWQARLLFSHIARSPWTTPVYHTRFLTFSKAVKMYIDDRWGQMPTMSSRYSRLSFIVFSRFSFTNNKICLFSLMLLNFLDPKI